MPIEWYDVIFDFEFKLKLKKYYLSPLHHVSFFYFHQQHNIAHTHDGRSTVTRPFDE